MDIFDFLNTKLQKNSELIVSLLDQRLTVLCSVYIVYIHILVQYGAIAAPAGKVEDRLGSKPKSENLNIQVHN